MWQSCHLQIAMSVNLHLHVRMRGLFVVSKPCDQILHLSLFLVFLSRLLFSKLMLPQGYIKEAGVARLRMWDLIFPFVINYKFVFFFFFALLDYLKENMYMQKSFKNKEIIIILIVIVLSSQRNEKHKKFECTCAVDT